ncbi:MBL fold metallo-hydrolase [Alphaproteobacteria bacterium]|jgi:phosphoribosyl 1,2-cyclic phosphodiesterase|nr:MBL fold metallo-hydrolase [Alphaproteobacteria bacterium]
MTISKPPFSLRFWGVRGSLPIPDPDMAVYGGNTACVEIKCGDEIVILDGGSGLLPFGRSLLDNPQEEFNLLLTHSHADHLSGLTFFAPLFKNSATLRIWAGHINGETVKSHVDKMISPPLFPVTTEVFPGKIDYRGFKAGESISLDNKDIKVTTCKLNHPGEATGYRIDFHGRSVCYITDTEHVPGEIDQTIADLIKGSDLVIYDCCLTEQEFAERRGWGHSTWIAGVELCKAAGAKRLLAFHHEINRTDKQLHLMDQLLDAEMPGSVFAREGMTIDL